MAHAKICKETWCGKDRFGNDQRQITECSPSLRRFEQTFPEEKGKVRGAVSGDAPDFTLETGKEPLGPR